MKKKIIIAVVIIIVLAVGGIIGNKVFANNGDLKVPKNLELKDEYKSKVSSQYAETLGNIVIKYVELYNQDSPLEVEDVTPLVGLSSTTTIKSGTELNETERLLLGKRANILGDLISELDKPNKDTKIKLRKDIQILLDCYK